MYINYCYQGGKDLVIKFQPGTTDVPTCHALQ